VKTLISIILILLTQAAFAETIILELKDKKFGKSPVPVEFVMPEKGIKTPVPLVILQHGSTQDAPNVFGGSANTDVHQYRLAKLALQNGFAVAVVDAFYEKGLRPGDKGNFPQAHRYAMQIAKQFSKNTELDPENFFYSGFSYGGHSVHMLMSDLYFVKNTHRWAGLVSAEAPCGTFHEPRRFVTPLLTIKGGESHYEPKPCQTMTNMYKKAGADAEIVIFPKSNHYFSHNGRFVKGIAVNGCADNPVIIKERGGAVFLDGSIATKEIVRKKCRTQRAGAGKTREDLDKAVKLSVDFFIKHLN
tara:strand:- start:198 stop:1106 length:909 start_codon:yes stop_codon:yes gene_type:complete